MEEKDVRIEGKESGHRGFVTATDRTTNSYGSYLWLALIWIGKNAHKERNSGKIEAIGNVESFEL